jgi:hypothetical protein
MLPPAATSQARTLKLSALCQQGDKLNKLPNDARLTGQLFSCKTSLWNKHLSPDVVNSLTSVVQAVEKFHGRLAF